MSVKLRIGMAPAYSQKDFRDSYRRIKHLTHALNRAMPQVRRRSRFDEISLEFTADQEAWLRTAARRAWPSITKLYTELCDIVRMLGMLRYYSWHFVDTDATGQEVTVQISGARELKAGELLEELHLAAAQTFNTCGYLMALFCLDVRWDLDKGLALHKFAYPPYTEGGQPLHLRRERRFIVADIQEDCKEQLALVREIFRLAEK